jgi:hypothetical protein
MAGHDAADQAWAEIGQEAHQSKRVHSHLSQMRGSPITFVDSSKDLDLIADLGVGREVCRLDSSAAQTFGRFSLGGEVLGFDPFVHQASGFKSDRLTKFRISHPFMRRYLAHRSGAGLHEL